MSYHLLLSLMKVSSNKSGNKILQDLDRESRYLLTEQLYKAVYVTPADDIVFR